MIYTEAQKQLAIIGDQIAKNIQDSIKKSGKFNTGRLYNSVRVKMGLGGLSIIIGAPYATFVLEGRRAGRKRPPIKAILSWLDTPHGKAFFSKLKKPETKQAVSTRKGTEIQSNSKLSAAFMLANSIAKKGISPMKRKNSVKLALSYREDQGFRALEEAYVKDVEAELKKSLAFLK